MFPDEISIVKRGGRWSSHLRRKDGSIVIVLACRSIRTEAKPLTWQIDPVAHERRYVTLIGLFNENNNAFMEFCIIARLDRITRIYVTVGDGLLTRGNQLPQGSHQKLLGDP